MTTSPSPTERHRRLWIDLALVAVIAAVAVALRYYKIGEVPPGFNSDEGVGAVGALDTLRNGMRLHYAGQGGGGALGFYIAALAFALFGPSIATIRGAAAFAGVVSVIAAYFLVREMFRTDTEGAGGDAAGAPRSLNRARLLAALAALGLATSGWHLQSSRIAFAAIGVPFLQAPASFFLWRGLNTGRRIHFVLSGILLASVTSIYMSGAFAPLVFLAFFLLQWAVASIPSRAAAAEAAPSRRQSLLTRHLRNLIVCAGVALLFVLPVLYFYLSAPELATQRAQQALFTNPLINRGDPLGTLWRSLWGNLGAFGLSLDWFQGQPPPNLIMPAPMTLLFLLGLAVSAWRIRRPANLFALVSWAIMVVPSILSPDSIPHQARALGASTAAYTLIAVGMLAGVEFAQLLLRVAIRAFARRPVPVLPRAAANGTTAAVLLGIWLAVAPPLMDGYRYYFDEWPRTNDAQAAYHVYAVDLAAEMSRETNPQAVFLLPRDTAAGDVNPNYTVMFLYSGRAGYAWVVDDENTIEQALNEAVAGRDVVHVVRWKTSKHTGADPKEIIRYYLEKHGRYENTRRFEYYDIETYQLNQPGPDLRDGALTSCALNFGDALEVTGYAFGDASGSGAPEEASVPAGDQMWARLQVRLLRQAQEDLKISVQVSDSAGHVAGQIDKLLLNNILHQGTTRWPPGIEADAYYLIPILPAGAPGRYSVQMAVYGASSQMRLTLSGSNEPGPTATLGALSVRPDLTPPHQEDLHMTQVLDQPVAPGLTLLGFAAPQNSLRPGDHTSVALLWRADAPLSEDFLATLWASQGGAAWPVTSPLPVGGADYPTSRWTAGEVVRGWVDGRLPRDLAGGEYRLSVRLTDPRGQNVADTSLAPMTVTSWTRRFETPEMQNALRANFGNQLELLGYDLKAPTDDSPSPEVILYWRALSGMDIGYTTFVHVLDEAGRVAAQVDHVPGDGALPTTGWLPGEVVADRFVLPAQADRIGAVRQIEAGVYNPLTMQRLPTLGADGKATDTRVLLPLTLTATQAGAQ